MTDYLPSAEFVLRLAAANIRGEHAEWGFDSHPRPGETLDKVKHWIGVAVGEASDIPHKRGAVLYGPAGGGKTGLAVAAARWFILQGYGRPGVWAAATSSQGYHTRDTDRPWMAPVRFEWWPDMYERFVKASRVTDPLEDTDRPDVKTLLTDIQREVSFLVIDDIDLGEYTAFKETLLLRLLQVTDGKLKNLVVTMNRGPVEAIPVLGERVVDRLFSDRFFCVHVTGGSLRRKDGRAEMAPPIPGVTGGLF